jgi:hypothetical protein
VAKGTKGCKQTREERLASIKTLVPGAAQTHGCYALQAADVKDWPPHIRRQFEDRLQELNEMPGMDAKRHRGALVQLVYYEILASVVRQFVLTHGMIKSKGKHKDTLQPILREAAKWEKLLMDSYRAMGLTPRDERYVKVREKSVTDWLAESDAEEADTEEGETDDEEGKDTG